MSKLPALLAMVPPVPRPFKEPAFREECDGIAAAAIPLGKARTVTGLIPPSNGDYAAARASADRSP